MHLQPNTILFCMEYHKKQYSHNLSSQRLLCMIKKNSKYFKKDQNSKYNDDDYLVGSEPVFINKTH